MRPNPQFPANLVKFTEEIVNGKLHFLYSEKKCKEKTKAVAQMCSVKKVFLEISQNLQENTCARVSSSLAQKRVSGTGVFL